MQLKTLSSPFAMLLAFCTGIASAAVPATPTEKVVVIVAKIQRADYGGDRSALKQLYGDLEPYANDKAIASRVAYWQGFALWRRALNGFNDSVDKQEQVQDLEQAQAKFKKSGDLDPGFVDAKVGEISCLGNLMFVNQKDQAKVTELLAQLGPVTKEAKAAAPDNPRLLWVLGPNYWYAPPERGGGQAKAIATYERGLEAIRQHKVPAASPLDPTWGEPELLMNLAWSNLNKAAPDPAAAQQYAEAALKLVPYWHYVRDILLPQIESAQKPSQ